MFFRGVITAIVTPFDPRDGVDAGALSDHAAWMVRQGVRGLLGAGTVGEGGTLSRDERRLVCRTLVEAADGRAPVTMAVSAERAALSVQFAKDAADSGAQALMVLPPVLYHADADELITFFTTVAAATELPLMVYNSPASSRNDMSPSTIAQIFAEIGKVVAVKECSEDARRMAAILGATNSRMEVLVGADDCALEGLCAGAGGWVSGCSNIAPTECVQLFDLCESGELLAARDLYLRLLPLARLDNHPKLVQIFKAALDRIGRFGGPVRPPRGQLTEDEVDRLDQALLDLLGDTLQTATTRLSRSG
jgi:dihydrodipicolinate synthase/N-acetylneuraminate lyase